MAWTEKRDWGESGAPNDYLFGRPLIPSDFRTNVAIDQFRYIKIQPKTIDLRTRLWGINPTNSVFIPKSLVLRSIVLS